jgi:hypothetical protein
MEIRKVPNDNGFEVHISVTNDDLIKTIEAAERENNKVVTAIASMPDEDIDKDPSLLLLLLASTVSMRIKEKKENTIKLSKGREL